MVFGRISTKSDAQEFENQDNELKDILDDIDISYYLDNNGLLKEQYYNLLSGDYNFRHTGNEDAMVSIEMDNPITEAIIGKLLLSAINDDAINPISQNKRESLGSFTKLYDYINNGVPFIPSIVEEYLESLKYISTERVYKKEKQIIKKIKVKKGEKAKQLKQKTKTIKKVVKVKNPDTNRLLLIDRPTYKKVFGKIILKQVIYKPLNQYEQIQYSINDNCAVDYLTKYEKFKKSELKNILNRKIENNITTDDLIKIYNDKQIGIIIYDALQNIYYESEYDIKRWFRVYNEHLYVYSDDPEKKIQYRYRIIDSIDDIDKYTTSKLIVQDEELFNKIKNKIQETHILTNYNIHEIPYKKNIIIYNPFYEIDKKILKDNNSKCRSIYSMIDSKIKLRGHLNNESLNYFYTTCKIRYQRSDRQNIIQIDMNKAYPSQFIKKDIYYPVPTINNYFYENTLKLKDIKFVKYHFYDIKLKTYDDIIAPVDGIYSGYACIKLNEQGRIKKVLNIFPTSNYVLFDKYDNEFIKTLTDSKEGLKRLTCYIGWLMQLTRSDIKYYDVDDNVTEDIEASKNYYGCELSTRKNKLILSRSYLVKKTGILTNILIKDLTNIDLYDMNNKMIELNQGLKLNTIKTDSLGYIWEDENKTDNVILPKDKMGDKIGLFKIEFKESKVLGNYKLIKEPKKIIPHDYNIDYNEYSINHIEKLITDNKSFFIYGQYGTGKSYNINNNITDILNKQNKKYVISSPLKENSKDINGETLHKIFLRKSNYEILTEFKDINYMIIDEATIIDQDFMKYLDFLKDNIDNIQFILLGDENQIKHNTLGFRNEFIKCEFLKNLCQNNKIKLTKNYRCEDKLINLIQEIKNVRISELNKFLEDNFQTTKDEIKTNLHLCLWGTESKLIKKHLRDEDKIYTIKSIQGKEFNEPFTIYTEHVGFMKIDNSLITALSRAKSWDQIYINNLHYHKRVGNKDLERY